MPRKSRPLKSAENSAVCELVGGSQEWLPSLRSLYEATDALYGIKSDLEDHLCRQTDDLFNQSNRIMLFDLTNFYFEGRKATSKKAKFGRSKEKRSDCRLLVLALCINTDGFIRYSSILEGNTADPKSLPDMVESLSAKSPAKREGTLVVIDAGIATEENLALIKKKGFNYLCVSRMKQKDYGLSEDRQSVTVYDSRKQAITLHEVCANSGEDHYLRICSPSKALTEASMNRQWRQRFEEELEKVNAAIGKKGGVKRYERVIERVGRAKEKYPSIARFYDIEYVRSEEKPDERADAHLFFGLLSYWVVNTVRLQLKRHGENCYWNEIVRRMSTQKLVTTQALNSLGEKVEMRICSEPTEAAAAIYDKLGYRHYPFRKMKICTTQT